MKEVLMMKRTKMMLILEVKILWFHSTKRSQNNLFSLKIKAKKPMVNNKIQGSIKSLP